MRQPVPVTERELGQIVDHACGRQSAPVTWLPLGGGQINDTRLLTLADGRRHVLRVAPSEATALAGPSWFTPYGLRREAAVIVAAPHLGEFLPVTLAHDFGHEVIDRDWVIQRVMPGVPLSTIDDGLDPAARTAIWTDLGRFTRDLHRVTSDRFGPPAWGPSFPRWSELVAWDVAGMVHDAGRFGLPVATFERLAGLVERLAPLLDEVKTPALIHSDLSRRHVFVEPGADGRVRFAGVIDLEFGRYADLLSEHLIDEFAWRNAPDEIRLAFMRGYGKSEFSHDEEARVNIYVAMSLAWLVPLLAFQGEPCDDIMADLDRAVRELERHEMG